MKKVYARPSRTIEKQKNKPGGVRVKPGTYRAELHYGDLITKNKVEVKSDPRLEVSKTSIDEVYKASKELEKFSQAAHEAVTQLVENKNIAAEYKEKLQKKDKKAYKKDIEATKGIIKKIDSIIAVFIGKDDKRQGITRNPEINVIQRLGNAERYVSSRQNGLTSTEQTLMNNAKTAVENALRKNKYLF